MRIASNHNQRFWWNWCRINRKQGCVPFWGRCWNFELRKRKRGKRERERELERKRFPSVDEDDERRRDGISEVKSAECHQSSRRVVSSRKTATENWAERITAMHVRYKSWFIFYPVRQAPCSFGLFCRKRREHLSRGFYTSLPSSANQQKNT